MINRENLHSIDFSDITTGEALEAVRPGEILADFLADFEITPYRLAKDTGMPGSRPGEIINKGRAITADTALRLGKYFGNSPEFWMNLQSQYDIRAVTQHLDSELSQIKSIAS